MKKFSLKSWIDKIQQVAIRFPFSLFFILGLTFYFFLVVNKSHFDVQPRTCAFFAVGIALSLTMTLFLENFKTLYVRVGINLLSVLLLAVYVFTLPDKLFPVHYYQLVILGLVFVLSAFFASFFKKDNDIPFWEFSKTSIIQLLIAGVFAQILMLGLSLAVLSLKELFKIDVQHEVYQNLAVICYVAFMPVYFLANIPAKTDKFKHRYTFPAFLKILGLYILLPILALYSLILYVYLIQIIVKWELPNGWVSTLVSILGLVGFLCMLILYPLRLDDATRNKVVNLFSKYFPVILVPLLVLMSVGIFRRLGDYGLTINRCYVLILNVWLYGICIYLFVTKANHLKWIVISFAAVALISSVGPWSVYTITEHKLTAEIGQLLNKAKLLKNGKVIDNSKFTVKVDSITSQKLADDIRYVYDNFGTNSIQPYFKDSLDDLSSWKIQEMLGLNTEFHITDYGNTDRFFANVRDENNVINIVDYKTFIKIDKNSNNETVFNDKGIKVAYKQNSIIVTKQTDENYLVTVPLKEKLKFIIHSKKHDTNFNYRDLTLEGRDYKLIITNIVGFKSQKNDSIFVERLQADIFLK